MNDLEFQIGEYVAGRMEPSEEKAFRERVENDAELAKQVNEAREAFLVVQQIRRAKIKAEMREIVNRERKGNPFRRRRLVIGSSAAVAATIAIMLFLFLRPQTYLGRYFQPYPTGKILAPSPSSQFKSALDKYSEGKYEEAIGLLEGIPGNSPDSLSAYFTLANAQLELGRMKEAKGILETLNTQGSDTYQEQVLWMLGLISLDLDEIETGKSYLQKLRFELNSDYQRESVDKILRDLR